MKRRSPGPAVMSVLLAWLGALLGLGCDRTNERPVSDPSEKPTGQSATAPGEPAGCRLRSPTRDVFFGDLHVHTARSMDAYATDTRLTPDEAYAFARGQTVLLPPLDADGRGTRATRLERPLDFAAVTDHAEYFGELSICLDPSDPGYSSPNCVGYRGADGTANAIVNRMAALMGVSPAVAARNVDPVRPVALCGEDGARCAAGLRGLWQEVREAAARWNDPSPECAFSTLIAYEWTLTPDFTKIHRNVIFRSDDVPLAPITSIEEPTPEGLWRRLRAECLEAAGDCDVLAIPHNSNLSNGRMFVPDYPADASLAAQAAIARERARMEPLVEIMQVKGDSECRRGLSGVVGASDEQCAFEEFRPLDAPDCGNGTGRGALAGRGCVSRLDYVRTALSFGLAEAERVGVNPYAFGVIASTDTHNGTPGDVEEYSFEGAGGFRDADPQSRLGIADGRIVVPDLLKNPGGLAAVWAEENSRSALFDALKRRETYGTSGPRIRVRLFGGWNYPASLCEDDALVAAGYAGGVPMGSDLRARPESGGAPRFVVSALRDAGIPEHPGALLERIQIVKGWVDDDGQLAERVYDVAGADQGATVDVATCQPQGAGSASLCRVWSDPDFDPARRAVYYARVLENPSCRWSGWECLRLRQALGEAPESTLPDACRGPDELHRIQERAWTSPIWYTPEAGA